MDERSNDVEIEIRPAVQSDEAFVYETWLKGHKRGSYDAKRIRDRVYFQRHHALIERILARGATVLVAYPAGDPDTILGYVVAEPNRLNHEMRPILHWVFVKLAWRRLGIATQLLEAAVPDPNHAAFTHWTCWSLAVPAPKGVNRSDRAAVRDARQRAVREAERKGESGGDTDDLLRRWPGMEYDPYAREA